MTENNSYPPPLSIKYSTVAIQNSLQRQNFRACQIGPISHNGGCAISMAELALSPEAHMDRCSILILKMILWSLESDPSPKRLQLR